MRKLASGTLVGAFVSLLGFLSTLASADEAAQLQRFGDWTYECGNGGCSIRQGLSNPENPTVVYGIVVSKVQNNPSPIMRLNFPLGVYLPSGIGLAVGDMKLDIPMTVCLPEGCSAIAVVTDELRSRLASEDAIKVRFYLADSNPREISYPLFGFIPAYTELTGNK